MKTITEFPRQIVEFPDMAIRMPDGCRLSARVWMPADADQNPVPAILEHLPYRKRDGTTARDALTHPYFAGHGYACIRVDMRGNGDSEGLMEDEYSEQELQDACDVIAWAARQPWCNGNGRHDGHFLGRVQCAAGRGHAAAGAESDHHAVLDRRPLRRRHPLQGRAAAQREHGLGRDHAVLFVAPAGPGDRRRQVARHVARPAGERAVPAGRLAAAPDAATPTGSAARSARIFHAIKAATLAVGGWGDGYKNAVSRLVSGIDAPAKGIVGPWIHKYPHFAVPKPAIGFLQEALRWWDRWLKGIDTGVENDPAMRLYVMDSEPPRDWYEERPGRWIAERQWPSPDIATQAPASWRQGCAGREPPQRSSRSTISSPQDCGMDGGEYCAIWLGPELPGDQRADDAKSACFDSAPLDAPLDIVGAPVIRLSLSADRPRAMVAVRLCDVQPDGASTRITYGVLNLCHRDSHEFPQDCRARRDAGDRAQARRHRLPDQAGQSPAGRDLVHLLAAGLALARSR